MGRSNLDLLREQGYIVYKDILPNRFWFNDLYLNYDNYVDSLKEKDKKN